MKNIMNYLFTVSGDVESFASELGRDRWVAVLSLHVELHRGHGLDPML